MLEESSRELDRLVEAIGQCVRLIKQPAYWQATTRLAQTDIDRTSAIILQILNNKPCRFLELVELIGIEAPSISRKVHDLVENGLVDSHTDPDDHRVHSLRLSIAGRNLALKLRQAQHSMMLTILKDWTDQDRQDLSIMLERLADNVGHYLDNSIKHSSLNVSYGENR